MTTKNPWLGLASYEEPKNDGNDYLFCGRDDETLDVVRLIDNNLFVTLYGSSGIGKTSLLRAGVIPILRRKDYFPLYVRLSQEPVEISYAEAIVRKLQNSGLTTESGAAMKHLDGNDRLYLWNYFATTRFLKDGREIYPVFILDQFEEVFREGEKAKAELLLKQIYVLLNDELEMPDEAGYSADTNYRFVASIREDFLFVLEDSIDELSMDLYKNNRYRLRPMKPENARQVVLLLGKDCIEESEKEEIAERVIELATNSKKHYIDTLLLSLVCAITFEKQSDSKLSLSDYDFWGDNPMRVYYQEAIKPLGGEQVRYIQNNLINKNGSRSKVLQKVLEKELGKETSLSLLKGTYRIFSLTSDEYVELLHDQLALTIFEDRDAFEERERNWKLMEMKSRFVAEKANKLIEEGDSYLAQRILIDVLPRSIEKPDKPYTIEAESVLRNAFSRQSTVLYGHSSDIYSAVFSPNGKRIVSTSADAIKIWNAESGQVLHNLKGHLDIVRYASFSPDNNFIVSASKDGTMKIWDAESGTEIRTLSEHTMHQCNSATFSPNGKLIVSASGDGSVRIWDTQTGQLIKTMTGHSFWVQFATFSPDGNKIVSASSDNTIKIWDAVSGREILSIMGHAKDVNFASFSPDGRMIVSASSDNNIGIWDAASGLKILLLQGHTDHVRSANFSPDGEYIASASWDNTIRIWHTKTGQEIHTYRDHNAPVRFVAFSPDGCRLISASNDKTIRLRDIKSTEKNHTFSIDPSNVIFGENNRFIKISSNGKRMVSVNRKDNRVCVWDAESGKMISALGFSSHIENFAISPNGELVVIAYYSDYDDYQFSESKIDDDAFEKIKERSTIKVWDVIARQEIRTIKGTELLSLSSSLLFTPDCRGIIISSSYIYPELWDVSGKKKVLIPSKGRVLSISSDGKYIVAESEFYSDYSLTIWNVTEEIQISTLRGHLDRISCATFSPDCKHIASASNDKTVKIWDVKTGKEMHTLKGHSDEVHYASFSPDGKYIISSSQHNLIIWNVEYEREVLNWTLYAIESVVEFISHLSKELHIFIADANGPIYFIPFPPLQELIDQTRERFKDRPLTPEERRMYYLE